MGKGLLEILRLNYVIDKMEGKSERMDKKERLKRKTHQRLKNHNARHIKRTKEGTNIAKSIKLTEVE